MVLGLGFEDLGLRVWGQPSGVGSWAGDPRAESGIEPRRNPRRAGGNPCETLPPAAGNGELQAAGRDVQQKHRVLVCTLLAVELNKI